MSEFVEFAKIGRLKRDMVITEKIDGTNAQVHIVSAVDAATALFDPSFVLARHDSGMVMQAGSRSRYLTVGHDGVKGQDNFGFAAWVKANAEALWGLGEGRHYGEWWGQGVQRGYGLTEKRFSLFNTRRWLSGKETLPACCHLVPVLKHWTFDTTVIDEVIAELARTGSQAAPGFMQPEGIVIYQVATGALFKCTLDKDDEPKSKNVA